MVKIRRDELLRTLPPEWPHDLLPGIRAAVAASGVKIVVLDDDPTGTQTVHGVPVLTGWSPPYVQAALAEPEPVVYLLTNSRSMPLPRAQDMNREIAAALRAAGQQVGREFAVVSRSDSTLRGHYPGEVEALIDGLGGGFDGVLIAPFFLEGGRLTIGNTHYVAEGDWLVPAAETEYARDAAFGYGHSDLRAWVSDKHRGRIAPGDVATIPLDIIRTGGPAGVAARLETLRHGQPCVVNAAGYRDLEVVVAALLEAEAAGRRFLYRTAASFVRVRAGMPGRGLLTPAELGRAGRGGLVVVGSHVAGSSAQLEQARALPDLDALEMSVPAVLDPAGRETEIARVADQAAARLAAGRDALIYTSRRLVTGDDTASSLRVGQMVSSALVALVGRLDRRPAWLVAKGGITSSDVATEALGVRRAMVLGQVLPGVPVWRLGSESRWPGLAYVVFPGNVGGPDALAAAIRLLRGQAPS